MTRTLSSKSRMARRRPESPQHYEPIAGPNYTRDGNRLIFKGRKSENSTMRLEMYEESPALEMNSSECKYTNRRGHNYQRDATNKRSISVGKTRRKPLVESLIRPFPDLIKRHANSYFANEEKYENEHRQLKAENEKLRSDLETEENRAVRLEADKAALNTELANSHESEKNLRKQLADLKFELENLQLKLEDKRQKKQKLRKAFIAETKMKEDEIARLKAKKRRTKSDLTQKVNELTLKVISLSGDCKTMEDVIKTLRLEKQETEELLSKNCRDLRSKLEKALIELEKKDSALKTTSGKLETVSGQLAHCQETRSKLETYNAVLLTHVCPKVLAEYPVQRRTDELLATLWVHFLRENETGTGRHYREEVEAVVRESECCTHMSVAGGLRRLGFYISHAEALSLIALLKQGVDPEDAKASLRDFLDLVDRKKPYKVWEDVRDVLTYFQVKFAVNGTTHSAVENHICKHSRNLTRAEVAKKLKGKTFNAQRRADEVASFLFLGSDSLPSGTVTDRLLAAVPPWKPYPELKTQYREQVNKLMENKRLKKHLEDTMPTKNTLTIDEFKAICESHFHKISDDMALYVSCINFEQGVEGRISIGLTLNYVFREFMKGVELSAVRPEDGAESGEDTSASFPNRPSRD